MQLCESAAPLASVPADLLDLDFEAAVEESLRDSPPQDAFNSFGDLQASAPIARSSPPAARSSTLLSSSLMDLISKQEPSGKWFCSQFPDLHCPSDFTQFPGAADLWVTLVVVVLIETKFARQADEWELVVRKARKLLRAAGVDIDHYSATVKAQLNL